MDPLRTKSGQGTAELAHADEVRQELDRILESPAFRGSKRCHDFLNLVVTRTLDGNPESLKERTLAAEIFGREPNAELGDDSIVRVGAREVRKRLMQYYSTAGTGETIRIDLPAGTYVPAFQFREQTVEPPAAPVPAAVSVIVEPSPPARWKWTLPAALLVCCVIAAFVWTRSVAPASSFEAFWAPAFQSKGPLLLVQAHPIVYGASRRARELDAERNGPAERPFQRPIQLPPKALDGSDYVPVHDQYVGFGDSVAAFRLAEMFSKRSIDVRMRLGSKVDFADLRDSAAILIGAYTNRWTMEITRNYPFRFSQDGQKPVILDSRSGR